TRFLPAKTGESVLDSMKRGFRFIRRQHAMGALIVLAFCMTSLSMPLRTFFPEFVTDIFRRGPETLGMFYSVMGLGSILGSLIIAAAGNAQRKGLIALSTLVCLGGSIAGFALSHNLVLSYSMLVVAGASMMAVFASVNSLVQLIVTNEMRGRVMSVYTFAFRGGMPLGNLAAGWLVKAFTAPLVLAVNGVLLAAIGLYYLLVERRVAEL
ncbi:MAG TPA: MFS transporter, partial [Candidatus Sulfopaludibacter sp.]|nr:MFS transporter [Candidatus Sulfopaludibacter sp.]